jgi:2-dehydro-3-deoxygalactonokinase
MIGSNLGLAAAPYLDCPVDAEGLRRGLFRVQIAGPPVWIVPGLRCTRPDGGPDVMRGEETQVLGWATADPARSRGEYLICHPGTHAKWVRLVDGRIERFVTFMTGELFDLLRKQSVLRVRDAEEDPSAFDRGVEAAGDGGALASRLFTARARVVGGDMPSSQAESYLSGLLIGAEVASAPTLLGAKRGTPVAVVGDPRLAARYLRVLRAKDYDAAAFDGDTAALSGLRMLSDGALVS